MEFACTETSTIEQPIGEFGNYLILRQISRARG